MNYKNITNFFGIASKICAVGAAAAIVLSTAATVILFPLVNLLSLASGNLREKFNLIIRNPVSLMFLVFCAMFLVGVTYSTASWPDILAMLRKYDKFLLGIMFFPIFIEERWRDYAINAFMVAVLVLLIASYLNSHGWLQYWGKGAGAVFKSTLEFNFLMAFAAYFCLLKTVVSRYRWMWALFLVFIVHTILFRSIGRSGYFVFIGLMALFFVQKFRWRGLVIAVVSTGLLLGAAFTYSPIFKGRINEIFSNVKTYRQSSGTSVGLRMAFVENSIKLIMVHPILGVGTGSFTKEYAAFNPAVGELTSNPHNEYIHIMVQFGVVGLMILLLLFGVSLWYSQFLPEKQKYMARGVVVGIMLGCLANSWLMDITEGYFYVYFIALAFATHQQRFLRHPAA